MGRRKRSRADGELTASECEAGWCAHGGRCVVAARGRACACAGAWGGARCTLYVGHDHACGARACPAHHACLWGPDVSATEAGEVYCACVPGAGGACSPPAPALAPPPAGAAGAWVAAVLVILSLAVIASMAALFYAHRRRQGAFVHARLADNVEISNPMYLAGEDELDQPHTHTNGGNHFANPVYESMYAPPQHNPAEEHATLLSGSPAPPAPPAGAERAALL